MISSLAVPGYQLLSRLGGGLLTSVYTARELATDQPCAVKVLRSDWDDQPMAVKLLQREARAGLLVHHSHLVALRDTHVTREPYFLVMDLLTGESLRQRLRRDYQCSVADSIWIVRQTAEALVALHRAGFLHGDVKPDNIHLTGDGKVILLDLGFAHRPGENSGILDRGYILGTVDYLAPELCSSAPRDCLGSDLFSLGITLFEMLTGTLPYRSGTVPQTIRRHECDPPADILKHRADLPPTLVKLIRRLLSHDPGSRPSADAVVRQLVGLEIAAMQTTKVA